MLTETSRIPQVKLAGSGTATLRIALGFVSDWRWRARTRRQLARLDANGLKDIGLTLVEQRIECAKPFWRG